MTRLVTPRLSFLPFVLILAPPLSSPEHWVQLAKAIGLVQKSLRYRTALQVEAGLQRTQREMEELHKEYREAMQKLYGDYQRQRQALDAAKQVRCPSLVTAR